MSIHMPVKMFYQNSRVRLSWVRSLCVLLVSLPSLLIPDPTPSVGHSKQFTDLLPVALQPPWNALAFYPL